MEEKKKKKIGGQQGELMRALNITMDDLLANHDGYIPDEQAASVLKRQAYQLKSFKVIPGVFTCLSLFFMVIASTNAEESSALVAVASLFILLAAALGIVGILKQQALKEELSKKRFETTQGIAVVNINEQKTSYLEINGMKLHAPPDVLRRIKHLDPYIVHYLPGTEVILSMEHIEETDNIREDSARSRLQDDLSENSTDTLEADSSVRSSMKE